MSKIILITGTSKGIGLELAKYYISKGNVVIGCSRSETNFSDNNYFHFCCDISSENQVLAMKRKIQKQFKKVDVCINNAGIASMNHLLTTTVDRTRKIFDTNFVGTFLLSREMSKLMMLNGGGKIVNFSTCAAAISLEGESIYAASKSAVESFTRTSSKELHPYNITVNAVGITPLDTDLLKGVPRKKISDLLERQTIKRMATFDDVINVVDFLINDRSSFITGQVIYLGGVL